MEESKKNLIKLGLYFGAFIILIIVFRFTGINTTNNATSNNLQEASNEENILLNINKLNNDYYKSNVYISLDDDAQTIEYEKKNDILIGVKKYHGESINFIKYNDNYYTYDDDNISKIYDFNYFDYDKTFLDLNNFKSLIELDSTNKKYYLNDAQVLELTFDIRDVLKLYNKINNAEYTTLEKQNIVLKVYSKNTKIEYMILDLTNLYNDIYDANFETVNYKINFDDTEVEDTSWLVSRLY